MTDSDLTERASRSAYEAACEVTPARAEKEALEAAGFVRLPTLWVFPEEAAAIYQIAKKHGPRVHEIKKEVRRCSRVSGSTRRPERTTES